MPSATLVGFRCEERSDSRCSDQSAIGEINLAMELQGAIGNARGVPAVKSEVTLVLSQSAIGEINLATELQGAIGNAGGVPV